jgi:hypothetical protein
MDPLTLGTLITTAVLGGLTLIVNLWQSVKFNHFKLNCSDCCTLAVDKDSDTDSEVAPLIQNLLLFHLNLIILILILIKGCGPISLFLSRMRTSFKMLLLVTTFDGFQEQFLSEW